MGRKTLLLCHPSDLFYGSGTAVIYRRLLQLLESDWECHHYISTWRSASRGELSKLYMSETRVIPHFARFKKARDIWGRVSRRWNRNVPDLRFPARLDADAISRLIRKINPDTVWWSGDYLPLSVCSLSHVPQRLLNGRQLCFSLYDPPAFWDSGGWSFLPHLQQATSRATSIDVIGENMASLIRSLGYGGVPVILNDYVDRLPEFCEPMHGCFRIVFAGQIYGGNQLQDFINSISTQFPLSEIHWFGTELNHRTSTSMSWPANVSLVRRESVDRKELPDLISSFHAGYLNLTEQSEGFAKYSVPTKLITYLEAGLPVLFHAPDTSEVHMLNERNGFGLNMNLSHSIEDIITSRRRFFEGGCSLIRDRYLKLVLSERLNRYLSF